MKRIIPLLIMAFVILFSCSESNTKIARNQKFINPPLEHISISFTEDIINAEKGDTTFYKTGSFIIFPPNSFLHGNGQIVKGDVKISFREYNNPIDFYLSGIPMNYDSSGVIYNFESMGMTEIIATQNGEYLIVNQENKPTINLASTVKNQANNCYYLDTTKKNWIYKNKTEIIDMMEVIQDFNVKNDSKPKDLIKPRKKTQRPSFNIKIEPGSIPELSAYNNLSFEITEYEKNFKPGYSQVLWDNVTVEKGLRKGTYNVTFEKNSKKYTFETWPVLSEQEYVKAMAEYTRKKNISDKQKDSIRLDIEKRKAEYEKEKQRLEEYNLLVRLHNDSIREVIKKERELRKNYKEQQRIAYEEQQRIVQETRQREQFVYSKFQIDNFGIWNCDNPVLRAGIRLNVDLRTKSNERIFCDNFKVVYEGFNGIVTETNDQLTYLAGQKIKIITIVNESFYFSTYNDYKMDTLNKNIEIKLTKDRIPKNYKDVCKNLGN